MPRGKYVNHKGRNRRFTSPEELQHEEQSSSVSDLSSGEGDSPQPSSGQIIKKSMLRNPNIFDWDNDSSDETHTRNAAKGVEALIEIENPNRLSKKATQKLENLSLENVSDIPELTRREREEIKKQKARQRYEKLHAAGKTTEAKADLARLALIRKQRDEAAAKRTNEKNEAEARRTDVSRHSSELRRPHGSGKKMGKAK